MKPEFNPIDFPPFTGFPKEGVKFLTGLKKNNNKEWFEAHRSDFESYIKQPMMEFIAAMAREFSAWAPEITANPKRSMFRIYRDVRFSADKSPYKTHAAASFHYGDKAKSMAGFYIHISPKDCYMGGGIWMPPNDYLRKIREKIAGNYKEFSAIVKKKDFVALGGLDMTESLKTMPRGFEPEHPGATYLKLKSFVAGTSITPEIAASKNLVQAAVKTYKTLLPLIRFLSE